MHRQSREKGDRWFAVSLYCSGWLRLEIEVERHLDLPWGADGVTYDAEARGAAIEVVFGAGGTAAGRQNRRSLCREGIVEGVLRNLVAGNIEAGCVSDVVDVEGVFES